MVVATVGRAIGTLVAAGVSWWGEGTLGRPVGFGALLMGALTLGTPAVMGAGVGESFFVDFAVLFSNMEVSCFNTCVACVFSGGSREGRFAFDIACVRSLVAAMMRSDVEDVGMDIP